VQVRVAQHQEGRGGEYTAARLPVKLVWCQPFQYIIDAIEIERRIKGWSRAKKEAMIRGDWDALPSLSRRRGGKLKQQQEQTVRAPR
jgi:putative endonuclease